MIILLIIGFITSRPVIPDEYDNLIEEIEKMVEEYDKLWEKSLDDFTLENNNFLYLKNWREISAKETFNQPLKFRK